MIPQDNTPELTVQFITAEEAIDLRSRVLRPGQSPASCRYPEDNDPTTFHLGIKVQAQSSAEKVVCNGTFMKDLCAQFPDYRDAYRLRGMATDADYQGRHFGSRLLREGERLLRAKGCRLLWFNAREKAFPFYEKNGFKTIGEMFEIASIGPHRVMYKIFD